MKAGYQIDDSKTHYMNVDLDVWSRSGLEPLAGALEKSASVLYVGPEGKLHGAHFEAHVWPNEDPSRPIQALARLVKRLPPRARRLWKGATRREFNIGIQAASEPRSFELVVAPTALRAIADVEATITITVYAPEVIPKDPAMPRAGNRTHARARGRRTTR